MKKIALIAVVLGLGASPAGAAAPGGWIAASVGQADVDFSVNDIDDGSFTSSSDDTGGTTFRLGAGYDFTDYVGLDAGWVQADDYASFRAVSDGSGWLYPASTVTGDIEASGFTFGFAGYLPVNDRFRVVGRTGIMLWTIDLELTLSGWGSGADSEDGSDMYLGVGLEYDIARAVSLGANFSRYDLDEESYNLAELGLRYRFGAR